MVEFLKKRTVVYTGESLPYKILCNDPYEAELKDLPNYEGFGGTREAARHHEREDPRFRWAAVMIRDFDPSGPPVDYTFSILKRLDMGNTKWSVVYDMKRLRAYFRTDKSPRVRFVDLHDFDLSGGAPAMVLDINRDLEGNVTPAFTPFTAAIQEEYVRMAWEEIDAGFFGNIFLKPVMKARLHAYIEGFGQRQ